jgi:hypothetical protein
MIHEFVWMCESVGMAQTVCVLPPAAIMSVLLVVVADRNRPLKHVQRARIVLYSADRECQKSWVLGRVSHCALTNLSSNMMANWVLAWHHSRGGIFHVCATWRLA